MHECTDTQTDNLKSRKCLCCDYYLTLSLQAVLLWPLSDDNDDDDDGMLHVSRERENERERQTYLKDTSCCSAVVTDNYCRWKWPLHVLHTIITIIISFIVNAPYPNTHGGMMHHHQQLRHARVHQRHSHLHSPHPQIMRWGLIQQPSCY